MKKYNFLYVTCSMWSMLFFLTSCQNTENRAAQTEKVTLKDDLGRSVNLSHPPRKFLSFAPSLTEMLFFVCDTAQVVGVTQNDNYPEAVRHKPIVNSYPIDFEKLLLLQPDLVFTKDGITSLADAERIGKMGIGVYYQTYETVEDVLTGIEDIGKITGHAERAQAKADSLRRRLAQIEQQTRSLPRPRVLSITWKDPIYVYGKNTILTDKLRLAGAVNAVDSVFNAPYPALSREYILRLNPDVILGGSFETMDSSFFRLYPELKRISAYRNRRVYAVTDDLNSRPSPRIVEAVEELKNLIHPAVQP